MSRVARSEALVDVELGPLATVLLFAAAVYLIGTRAMRVRYWLYPSVILGSLGILAFIGGSFIQLNLPLGLFVLTTLMLMNLLVLFAHWVKGNESRVGSLLGISGIGCERPLYQWPFLVTAIVVLSQGVFFCLTLLRLVSPLDPQWPWVVTPILACGLYLQLFYLERRRDYVHLLVMSSLLGCLAAVASIGWKIPPDIAVAILGLFWGIVAAGLAGPRGDRVLKLMGLPMDGNERHTLSQSMAAWSAGLLVLATIVTVPTWTQINPNFPSTSLTLLLVAIGFVAGGYQWRRVGLEGLAAVLLLASICTLLVFNHSVLEVLPTAGLATIALSIAYLAISRRLTRHSTEENEVGAFATATGQSLVQISAAFTVLAAIGTILSILWLSPSVPTAMTLGLICICWLYLSWSFKSELLVYLTEAALICVLIYIRHGILGTPFRPELVYAFGVVGMAFLLYGLNILASRGVARGTKVFVRPTYYSALLLPLALIVVTPLDDRAALSWVTCASASFYVLVARKDHLVWATYLAAVLFNVAIYLWIPIAHETTGLLTLYVIPAALTVLIFSHLHHGDLNRYALSGIRLAASAAILAVSTFEVFSATDSLLKFVVVLLLSLTGAIAGIALRIRPFVYMGSGFLVINVLGQLGLQIHSQGGLVRAVILIALGFAVVGMMIFFNIKREALLKRYRSFIKDPRWE